jgi:predicted RND superfamily exporter protein
MSLSPPDIYNRLILKHPGVTLAIIALVVIFFALQSTNFKLDASGDSLVLENDETLRYYRAIRARYGSDDFLIITYSPNGELISEAVLADLRALRDKLAAMDRVESVVSLLDVPLINSPSVSLKELSQETRTLETPGMNLAMAEEEFVSSPLYRNLLISEDKRTTALQVIFRRDETYYQLLNERDQLREKRLQEELSAAENLALTVVSKEFDAYSAGQLDQQRQDIETVRRIMDEHRDQATLYLGGVPMIVADSIEFIRHDLMTFGVGVFCFLVIILAVAFRRPRWVLLPLVTCFATGTIMIGILGLVDWPVTVVSSNFISLLLIITLSLTVHLIVRYRELHALDPAADQPSLVLETLRTKVVACFYTAATTMVAFGSLLFSGIRPVIDFGWMMAIGTALAFILAFTLFPATLMFLRPQPEGNRNDITAAITGFLARLIRRHGTITLSAFGLLAVMSVIGINQLTVENRFIDYYKKTTEIYRGMELIDNELGGTTPLDVIIDAPASYFAPVDEPEEDPLFEDFEFGMETDAGITGNSYWFNTYMLRDVDAIHDYLDELPESGKVLSITTAMRMLKSLNEKSEIDDFFLAILYKRLPDSIRNVLFTPYMSEDGNQLRFSIRVYESDPSLRREALLQKIRQHLTGTLGLEEDQVHVSGMLVLYNNMLQSLFRSQILTLGVVFLAIMLMFVVSFRSVKLASIAIIPNVLASLMVLGIMGWLKIPLDIMTITIAAIVIGIAVDNAIHYIHRFKAEFSVDRDYWATVMRCHGSIGRAMYYTTVTITLGFAILVLSSFIPTIYFGMLTGFSMVIALLANLTLLPLLLVLFKPLGAR